MDISIHLYVLLCCYFLKADGIKPPQVCGQQTSISFLVDYSKSVPKSVYKVQYDFVQTLVTQKFGTNKLQVSLVVFFNSGTCSNTNPNSKMYMNVKNNEIFIAVHSEIKNPGNKIRNDYNTTCANRLLYGIHNTSKTFGQRYTISFVSSKSLSEEKLTQIIKNYENNERYLLIFISGANNVKATYYVKLLKRGGNNYKLNNRDAENLLKQLLEKICRVYSTTLPQTRTTKQNSPSSLATTQSLSTFTNTIKTTAMSDNTTMSTRSSVTTSAMTTTEKPTKPTTPFTPTARKNIECGKPTGIAILIDYTEGVPDAVLTEIYRIEVRMQQRFKDNSLVKNSHQYNGVSCGNTTNLQLDDPVSNPRKTYRMDSANFCLKEYLKSLTNDGSRRRRNFYSMNIALSTSVEEWIPDHIKQKNIGASKYLVFFVNASDGKQRIFDINLPTKDNLLINDIHDLLDKIILFVCQYTPTATPVTATKRQGSSTFYLPTTSTSRSRPSQPTRSSRPSRPYSSSSTSRPTRPSRPSTDSRTSRPSRRSRAPHTSPTNTKRKKLKKEIRNFTSQNITTEQLSNTTWATNFLQSSSELLNQTQQKDTDVEEDDAEEMMKFIEETLVKVGTSLPVGASVSIVTESLVADVTAVETKTFQGYLFPNQSTTENTASLLNLPHNLLKNSTSDKTGIVGMKFKPLVSMKKVANHLAVGDDVISISVDPPVRTPFEEPINYTMRRIQNNFNHQQCVYWNTSLEKWDSFGCNVSEISEEYITCQCTHMTSFSILMQVKDFEIADKHVFALAVLTYVGCGVSVASCICLILIYVCLRRMLRIDRNVIHVNLSFAIAIANALFLSAGSATKKKDICLGISIGMLYFYLATFFWMFVEGVHVYLMMFKVFKSKKRMPIYLLIGWVFPAFITAGVSLKYHSLMTTEEFCWLSTEEGVIWAFVGPALFVIVVNTVILCMTLVASRRISVGDDGEPELKRIARLTLVLMPIFGISWVIGVFAINKQTILFQYIFTAVNVFQGLFIFIGYGMMNNEVRREASRRKQMFHSADISRSISTGKTNYASTMKSHRFSSVDNPTYNGGYLSSTSDAVDTPSPSNSYRSSIVGDAPQDKELDYAINESYRSSTFLTQQKYLTKQ